MAFNTYGVTTSAKSEKKSDVDWNALNQYVVETCKLEQKETLAGYVSMLVDLGIQKQPDNEYVSTVDAEEDYLDDNPTHYFKDGIDPKTKKPARMLCKPAKDQQSVIMAVDFPDIMVDKGQFFGESNPKPLRLWMGGQFYTKTNGMILGRTMALRETNIAGDGEQPKWSFAKNNIFYKMALASKLIKDGDVFKPARIDELLGKAFQFSVQVYFRKGKDGKDYFTENINFVGALGRGQAEPEIVTEPIMIGFNDKNKPEHLKEIRSHVVNTMKMAKNWEGSPIQSQLEALYNSSGNDDSTQEDTPPQKEEKKPVKAAKKAPEPSPEDEFDEESLPF